MTMNPKRATIKEVASTAGVSHQTVSRYLRYSGAGMKPQTQKVIRAAIDELDYRPNLAARAMRTTRTGRLAVVLPEGTAHSTIEVMNGLTSTAQAKGYDVDVVRVGGTGTARDHRILELVESGLFEGLLSLTPLTSPESASRSGTRVTVYGIYDAHLRGIGPLADASPIDELIARLAAVGHRRFLHLAGDYAHESARARRDTYRGAVERLGLESHGIVETHWLPEAARQAIRDLPGDSGVTAVIAANDLLAAAAIRGALERGWQVPGDISVTGFDTQPIGEWMTPSLTSVEIDCQALGRHAMCRLLAILADVAPPTEERLVTAVRWHQSTGPASTASPPVQK
ncbi:MAG TPA: LacI family DNA-binding transcriptional regulator [Arachnia sp.]|nr:LacI family DNA-binding transcriptional regulator [Arachnia sp.]HMT87800.1 LacI family DNA-binding transcriptional regulator [Arachnia sp.]